MAVEVIPCRILEPFGVCLRNLIPALLWTAPFSTNSEQEHRRRSMSALPLPSSCWMATRRYCLPQLPWQLPEHLRWGCLTELGRGCAERRRGCNGSGLWQTRILILHEPELVRSLELSTRSCRRVPDLCLSPMNILQLIISWLKRGSWF